jgi:hypothetical protein
MNDAITIDEVFKEIKSIERLNFLKSKLGLNKKIQNPKFDESSDEDSLNNPKFITITEPTSKFSKYLECKAKYEAAQNWLENAQNKIHDGDAAMMAEVTYSGRSRLNRAESALKAWEIIGFKNEIEKIILTSIKYE